MSDAALTKMFDLAERVAALEIGQKQMAVEMNGALRPLIEDLNQRQTDELQAERRRNRELTQELADLKARVAPDAPKAGGK